MQYNEINSFLIYIAYSLSDMYNIVEGILRFPSTELSDEGWYWCNATSGDDSDAVRLYLTVRGM